MTGTGPRGLAALLLAAMVMFAAGCGSSSKTITAPDTPKQIAADKAVVKQTVLKLSDLPAGYKASPHEDASEDDFSQADLQEFATCAKVPKSMVAELLTGVDDPSAPSADSPDFEQSDPATGFSTSFENSVGIERSSKDISEPIKVLGATSALKCWRALFKSQLERMAPPGGSVRDLTVVGLPSPAVGDESTAFGIRVTVSGAQRTIKAFVDIYLVRRGRAGISLSASGIGERVDSSLALSLLHTVDDRVKEAF
jgi:hypothetical protein